MASNFIILPGVDVTINGNFMDAVTGVQFEPYGPATSSPTLTPTGPLTPTIPITSFTLVNSTTLVVPSSVIDGLFVSGDLTHATWYQAAIIYSSTYQPPYILAQTARPNPVRTVRLAGTATPSPTMKIACIATLMPYTIAFYDFEGSTSGPWVNKASDGTTLQLIGYLVSGVTYPSTVNAGVNHAVSYNGQNWIGGNNSLVNEPAALALAGNFTVEWSEGPWVHNTFPISWMIGTPTGNCFIYRDQASATGWRFNYNDGNGNASDITIGAQFSGISSSPHNNYNVRFALTCQRNTPTNGTATYSIYRDGVLLASNTATQMHITNFNGGLISMGTAWGGSGNNNRVPAGMYQDEYRLTSKVLTTAQMLSGGLIPPSASSTFHCFWRDGAPYVIAGGTPLKFGSPTDVANASVGSPTTTYTRWTQAISGVSQGNNYWYLPSTDTSAKLSATGNWTITIMYKTAPAAGGGAVFTRGAYLGSTPFNGYFITSITGGTPVLSLASNTFGAGSGTEAASVLSVVTFSRNGNTTYTKLNLNTTINTVANYTVEQGDYETRFMNYYNNLSSVDSRIQFYEVRILNVGLTQTQIDALHTSIVSTV